MQVPLLDIPYSTPLVFHFDEALEPIPTKWAVAPMTSGWYMGDPDRIKKVQEEIQSNLGCNPFIEDCPGVEECIIKEDNDKKWICS